MENTDFIAQIKQVKHTLNRRLKSLKLHLVKVQERLDLCQTFESVFHEAENLKCNLYRIKKGAKEITIQDIYNEGEPLAIQLNPKLTPTQELELRYKQARKLRKGLPYAIEEVATAKSRLEQAHAALTEIESIDTEEKLLMFIETHSLKPQDTPKALEERKKLSKPYWEYISTAGIPIWVGKSAALNDLLTFQHANGNDLWLHVTGFPGSHVVIHTNQEVDDATLQEALQLTLYHSKAKRQGEGEVSITRVKYVKHAGRVKGRVQIANERRIFVRLGKNLIPRRP